MKILITAKWFPMCGANYFKWAMEELGHEVFTVGYFSGDKVPWEGNPSFPKYVFPPDMPLKNDQPMLHYDQIKGKLPWEPDLVLQIDAGFFVLGVPKNIPNALFATDPHFLDYSLQYSSVDFFFNPQPSTFKKYPKSIPLYWAYDPKVHFSIPNSEKKYDIVFIGLLYEQRKKALEELNKHYNVYFRNAGIIYEECTRIYNEGKISFNWSSNDDIPMRIFEGMAYGDVVVTNRITGLEDIFREDRDYIGYSTEGELMEKIKYLLNNPQALDEIASNGYVAVENHTYVNRCKKILREVFHD